MIRFLVFVCALVFVAGDPKKNANKDVVYTIVAKDKTSVCTSHEAKMWSYGFHGCFIDKKYTDGGTDLLNIVDRILRHSNGCVKNSTKHCRPDQAGFLVIMEKIIHEMKDYSFIYLEHISHDRHKVKDLDCVEKGLSLQTYKNCFKNMLDKGYTSEELQKEAEKAITCTNKSQKDCSKVAKTEFNRMVRNILALKQPKEENIEDDPEPEPEWKWYDYIIQPFISAWNAIKSFFG